MDEKMTILFIGFDGYSDIWEDCFSLYNKFWPDCPYRTLFVNNVKPVSFNHVEVLHAGADAEWSRKVQIALKKITTPYVCLLLEDFFVGELISTSLIKKTVSYIEDKNIKYFKLTNMSRAVKNHDPIFDNRKYLHVIPESDEYGISLQAAIWKKTFLEEKIGQNNYNAWVFEFDRVKECIPNSNKNLEGCVFDDRNILNLKHGVVQSKYIPTTVRYFNKKGINLNVQREQLSYLQYLRIQSISLIKYIIPKSIRKPVKSVMEKLGMKFVSTVRGK